MAEVTERGFRVFERLTGDQGWNTVVRVQESSAALRGPCVWIFEDGRNGENSVHLDYEGAQALIAGLETFVDEARRGQLTEKVADGSDANG